MEKYITDERTGMKYELIGDYYLIAGDDEPEERETPIGIWGKRHHEFIRRNKRITLSSLQISGKVLHRRILCSKLNRTLFGIGICKLNCPSAD